MRALFVATTILFAASVACSGKSASPNGATSADGGLDATSPLSDDTNDTDAAGNAGDDAPASSGDDAPTSAGDDDASAGDDANGGTPDAGGDSAPNPFSGAIFATSDSTTAPDGGMQVDYSVGAYFAHQTSPDDSIVSTTNVGPCVVQVLGNGDGPTETDESAGVVAVSGGKKTIKLTPKAAKTYTTTESTKSDLWNGGETITVTADGGDVPAFSTTLVAPSKITLATPTLPSSSGALTVSRNAPFTATWTGASSGSVVIYFDTTDSSHAYTTTCKFAASAGTGEVPATAFANFPAGSGSFNFYVETSATPVVAGWSVQFNASSQVVDATGVGAIGNTTYP